MNPHLLVLDTNVVLDWLVFDDARAAPIAAAVVTGQRRWIATAGMRDELAHVLRRGIRARPGHGIDPVLGAFDRWATIVEAREDGPRELSCTDRDDQKFVDLALERRVTALVSRDRAVLKLARRAAIRGLRIVTPERWACG